MICCVRNTDSGCGGSDIAILYKRSLSISNCNYIEIYIISARSQQPASSHVILIIGTGSYYSSFSSWYSSNEMQLPLAIIHKTELGNGWFIWYMGPIILSYLQASQCKAIIASKYLELIYYIPRRFFCKDTSFFCKDTSCKPILHCCDIVT